MHIANFYHAYNHNDFYPVQHNSLIFNNPDVSDAGKYTCRLPENHSENITATLIITCMFIYI